ncbi:MAG TPA: sensor domain-containing diguanylate cyclase [Capsulimonadaceae bacterium]|jgi:diguanylate cyclase (GGDEF)-like protein
MSAVKERVIIAYAAFALGVVGIVVSPAVVASHNELKALLVLALAAVLYGFAEKSGWLSRYFERDGNVQFAFQSRLSGVNAAIGLTAFFAVSALYVLLTGGVDSPYFFLLYQPVVMMALRFGSARTFAVSLILSAVSSAVGIENALPAARIAGISLSFPIAALFGAAVNLRLRRSERQLAKRVRDLDNLVDISRMLETAIDIKTTLNLILINAPETIDFKHCAVYLCDEADPTIMRLRDYVPRASHTCLLPVLAADPALRDVHTSMHDKVLVVRKGASAQQGESALIGPESGVIFDSEAIETAYAPLRGADGLIGLICFSRGEGQPPFSPPQLGSIAQYSLHVGLSIQQALYRDRLERLAFNDSMTGLANYRYFEKRLVEELSRCRRSESPLSVIMLDIDHFKHFNDTYGHKAGDMLLSQVGLVMRNALRDSDIPARYGGEEFVIVCPETSAAQAGVIMERIRTAVEAGNFDLPHEPGEPARYGKVTVSVGGATYPYDADNGERLVTLADKALYVAKETGRNRSVSAAAIAVGISGM